MNPLPATLNEAYLAIQEADAHARAAEVALMVGIAKAAELYEVDDAAVMDAVEGFLEPGGDGTPSVGEFLAHELGGILQISPDAALEKIGTVLDVRFRFPALWEAFLSGSLRWWQVAEVVNRPAVSQLKAEAASRLDRKLAVALRLWSWQRIHRNLEAWIIAADPDAARERENQQRENRYVAVDAVKNGHCALYGILDPRDAIDFDHALTEVAKTLPTEAGDLKQRRAAAVGVLARQAGGQEMLPQATVFVHINADDPALNPDSDSSGVAEVERWGAFLTSQLPRFLKDSKVTVRPILDPVHHTPEDLHDPSVGLRMAVTALMPVDVFPYASRASRSCDLDHTIPYRDGVSGQTRWGNLAPLARRSHRAKTFGGWMLTQVSPGWFHWRSPAGFEYLVHATGGTMCLRTPEPVVRVEEPPPPWLDPPEPPETRPVESEAWEWIQYALC